MAKIFVSHRTDDLAAAEQLAVALRTAGHTVWLDHWNLSVGDSLIEQINAGLANATHVIICYSASGIQSPWMSREWMSALARNLNGEGVKLLPAVLPGGAPPAILADIKYADLSRDWLDGFQQLLNALQ